MALPSLQEAAEKDDVETVKSLLDATPELIDAADDDDWTPLQSACDAGSLEAARCLLDRGAEVDVADEGGVTPLMLACQGGHAEVVSLLLARGAQPMLRDAKEETALMYASRGDDESTNETGRVAVVRLLLKDGRTEVDARDKERTTALYMACDKEQLEIARVLLVEGRASHIIAQMPGHELLPLDEFDCGELGEWYEGELKKAFLLTKARAVMDDTYSISKAPEKAGAKDDWEGQAARERAAPAHLKERVKWGEALPVLDLVRLPEEEAADEEEEKRAVLEHLMLRLDGALFVELMEGLRYRWQLPFQNVEDLDLGEETEQEEEPQGEDDEDEDEEGEVESEDGVEEGEWRWWEKEGYDECDDDDEEEETDDEYYYEEVAEDEE